MKFVLKISLLISLAVCEAKVKAVTIGLIGDSTVAVQSGWGPAFAERFEDRAKIVNYAKNGATLQALSGKLDELVELQPDYILIRTSFLPDSNLTWPWRERHFFLPSGHWYPVPPELATSGMCSDLVFCITITKLLSTPKRLTNH